MRAGDISSAAALLERHLATTAPRPRDYLKLATARGALGDLRGSLDAVSHALELCPGSLPALLMSGSLLTAMGRSVEARTAYEAALIRQADDAPSNAAPDRAAELEKRNARLEAVSFDDLPLNEPARARAEQFRTATISANRARIERG